MRLRFFADRIMSYAVVCIVYVVLALVVGLSYLFLLIQAALRGIGSFVLPSSFAQLVGLIIRRAAYSRRQRLRCWNLLRRARKGKVLSESEWNELLSFAGSGLLHTDSVNEPYVVAPYDTRGLRVWHPRLVVWR